MVSSPVVPVTRAASVLGRSPESQNATNAFVDSGQARDDQPLADDRLHSAPHQHGGTGWMNDETPAENIWRLPLHGGRGGLQCDPVVDLNGAEARLGHLADADQPARPLDRRTPGRMN